MFIEECAKKNHFYISTMESEIERFDIISFDFFDSLVLRDVLFPVDILKLVSAEVCKRYGIVDFDYIRYSTEAEVRSVSNQSDPECEDISLDEIYSEIGRKHPDYPIDEIRLLEIETEMKHACANPLFKILFDRAVELGKRIWIVCDSVMDTRVIDRMLKKCGYFGYEMIFASGEFRKAKGTGGLYRVILDETEVEPSSWLHMGCNSHSDSVAPQTMGITCGLARCPRECFFVWRNERQSKRSDKTEVPFNSSLHHSLCIGKTVNKIFTLQKTVETDVVIAVDNVSIMFNMSPEKTDNLKEFFIKLIKGRIVVQKFWALKNVSFSVKKGEKLGIVGLNGSGKSTLLKTISRVLKPTEGSVRVAGNIAPLIELGAGFDAELSARENIFLNGAILGYTRERMESYYDSIIEFAELEEFQDIAVKNFSSGMIARLGFAIATCEVPDILIIDEILSVGDFAFQQKCHRKMNELTSQGATVLFVSHSSGDIVNMCDRAIWLEHGEIVADGEAQYIVNKYLNK